MKKHRRLSGLCCLLALLVLLGGLSVPACAAGLDPEREGSLCLSLFYEGRPVSGGDLRLYRVGEIELDGADWSFRLLDGLGGGRLDQKALDSPGLAERLAAEDALEGLSFRGTVFGADGTARFDAVKPGLYLLTQSSSAEGFALIAPILVSLPYYMEGEGYVYDVDASVKPAVAREATPSPTPGPDGPLPETGQLNWPVPVLAGLGLCFLLLGALLLRSDRRRRKT